jgi:hypothetical protein
MRLLTMSLAGRDRLIERSLEPSPTTRIARGTLGRIWLPIQPVFWHVADRGKTTAERASIRSAAARVLRKLNESDGAISGLGELLNDTDPEVRAQARVVLAAGAYSTQLGPSTYRLIERHVDPTAMEITEPPPWQAPERATEPPRPIRPPPTWISIALAVLTIGLPGIVLPTILLGLGSDASCCQDGEPPQACN